MKKITSLLLTAVMLVTMLTVFAVPASAENATNYSVASVGSYPITAGTDENAILYFTPSEDGLYTFSTLEDFESKLQISLYDNFNNLLQWGYDEMLNGKYVLAHNELKAGITYRLEFENWSEENAYLSTNVIIEKYTFDEKHAYATGTYEILCRNRDDGTRFWFTPDMTATYSFESNAGRNFWPSIDGVYKENGEFIPYTKDNKYNGDNFYVTAELEAGETYYLEIFASKPLPFDLIVRCLKGSELHISEGGSFDVTASYDDPAKIYFTPDTEKMYLFRIAENTSSSDCSVYITADGGEFGVVDVVQGSSYDTDGMSFFTLDQPTTVLVLRPNVTYCFEIQANGTDYSFLTVGIEEFSVTEHYATSDNGTHHVVADNENGANIYFTPKKSGYYNISVISPDIAALLMTTIAYVNEAGETVESWNEGNLLFLSEGITCHFVIKTPNLQNIDVLIEEAVSEIYVDAMPSQKITVFTNQVTKIYIKFPEEGVYNIKTTAFDGGGSGRQELYFVTFLNPWGISGVYNNNSPAALLLGESSYWENRIDISAYVTSIGDDEYYCFVVYVNQPTGIADFSPKASFDLNVERKGSFKDEMYQSYSMWFASVLSTGDVWIIIAVAVLAVGGVAALVIVKKKKQPAVADGAEKKDEEE